MARADLVGNFPRADFRLPARADLMRADSILPARVELVVDLVPAALAAAFPSLRLFPNRPSLPAAKGNKPSF